MLATARERDRAPDSLRTRIERERLAAQRQRRGPRLRIRPAFTAAAAGVLAAVAATLAIILPAGSPGAPTIAQATALSLKGPTGPAPASLGTRLGESVGEVYFPDWQSSLGWRAVGERTDTLGGHRAVTIYYARGAEQVAYTIVATPPLPEPSARRVTADSLTVRALSEHGRMVVTWRRSGDTCVLSATHLDAQTLARLAAWSQQADTA